MGLREKLKPKPKQQPEQQQPEQQQTIVQSVDSSVAVVPPPAPVVISNCPHNKTRIIEIRSDFSWDENGKIINSASEPLERFEECLWCGEWLDLIEEEESTEETKPSVVAGFEW